MKKKNIKVGEYIVQKTTGKIYKVRSDGSNSRTDRLQISFAKGKSGIFRRPRIRDLKKYDVFEMYGEEWFVCAINSDRIYAVTETGGYSVTNYSPLQTPIRIISLASEKPVKPLGDVLDDISQGIDPTPQWAKDEKPEKKRLWVNVLEGEEVEYYDAYKTKADASKCAGSSATRVAVPYEEVEE